MASILGEYLNKRMGILELRRELSRLRHDYDKYTGRSLFIYAADLNKGRRGVEVDLMQDDFYTIQDILRESKKETIDVYIETPGGSGETAEEIARFLHAKFKEVNFVIAGEAKSAGTIFVMCADNIYMCSTGSLGPIDAQVKIGRKVVSAYDYKRWIDDKRKEYADPKNKVNPVDAIVLAQVSPGELYGVVNSLDFAKDLVRDWLVKYKFKNWSVTETQHLPVTDEMKIKRASDFSEKLCNHMDWHTHGRSLKIEDLKEELLIEDIDQDPKLADIIYRIKTVIRLIFDTSTDYKLFYWEDCEFSRTANAANPAVPIPRAIPPMPAHKTIESVNIEYVCPACKKKHIIPGYVGISKDEARKLKLPIYPLINKDCFLQCDTPGGGFAVDLKPMINDFEGKNKKQLTIQY